LWVSIGIRREATGGREGPETDGFLALLVLPMRRPRNGTPRREKKRYHRLAASLAYNPGSSLEKYSLKQKVIDSVVISQQDDV
jgi:hypothetical protein